MELSAEHIVRLAGIIESGPLAYGYLSGVLKAHNVRQKGIPFSAQGKPILAADEAKAVAEFEKELLQALNNPILQLAVLHRPADAEEFKIIAGLL